MDACCLYEDKLMVPRNSRWEVVKNSASPLFLCVCCQFSLFGPMNTIISGPKEGIVHMHIYFP